MGEMLGVRFVALPQLVGSRTVRTSGEGGGASRGAGVNVKWKGQPPGSDDVDDSGNPLLSSQPPLPPPAVS